MHYYAVMQAVEMVNSPIEARQSEGLGYLDFFEKIHGRPFHLLDLHTELPVQVVRHVSILGKHYYSNGDTWVRYAEVFSADHLLAARVKGIYMVAGQLFFSLFSYRDLQVGHDGMLFLAAGAPHVVKHAIAMHDFVYLNYMFPAGEDVEGNRQFVEMHM